MKKKGINLIILVFLSLSVFGQLGERKPVANTNTTLIPPEHFTEGNGFNGFMHIGSGSTIAITETIGRPYVYLGEVFGLTDFENQGASLITKENLATTAGDSAMMYLISFEIQDVIFERIILFTGDYNKTITIMANFPQKIHHLVYDMMKESVLSIEF